MSAAFFIKQYYVRLSARQLKLQPLTQKGDPHRRYYIIQNIPSVLCAVYGQIFLVYL